MKRTVHDHRRVEWTVTRGWLPRIGDETWRRRLSRRSQRWYAKLRPGRNRRSSKVSILDVADGVDLFSLGGVVVVLGGLVIVVLVVLLLPYLVALIELAILIPLALVAVAARLGFGRPWAIDLERSDRSTSDDSHRYVWRVQGLRESARLCRRITSAIEGGHIDTVLSGMASDADGPIPAPRWR